MRYVPGDVEDHVDAGRGRAGGEPGRVVEQYLGALRIIGRSDDCRVADLAREAAITVGAASKVVDRL